jgi:hypothetical protein
VSRTSFLVAIAVAVLMIQFFPNQAGTIKWVTVALGILYLVIRALRTYPKQYRDKKRRAALAAADDQEYRLYKTELDSIRTKYDPRHEMDENGAVPQAYKDELSALHDKHRAMLTRKFGPD